VNTTLLFKLALWSFRLTIGPEANAVGIRFCIGVANFASP
jgi:hypothetical protein